jgi:hypothetical protein
MAVPVAIDIIHDREKRRHGKRLVIGRGMEIPVNVRHHFLERDVNGGGKIGGKVGTSLVDKGHSFWQ